MSNKIEKCVEILESELSRLNALIREKYGEYDSIVDPETGLLYEEYEELLDEYESYRNASKLLHPYMGRGKARK